MIFKKIEYIIRINGSVGFDVSKNKEGEPVISLWADGKYVIYLKGQECYRLLEALQDALKENKKHE